MADYDYKEEQNVPFRAQKRVNPAHITEKSTCCTKDCLKTFMIFFILIILLSGIALVGAGIYMLWQRDDSIALLAGPLYYIANFLIIAAGSIIFITGIIGLIGVCFNMKTNIERKIRIVIVFTVLLVIILLLELAGGLLAYIKLTTIKSHLTGELNTTMIASYGEAASLTRATDLTQEKHRCCGVVSYRDWTDSPYILQQKRERGATGEDNKTPESCCKTKSTDCSRSTHPSNINAIVSG